MYGRMSKPDVSSEFDTKLATYPVIKKDIPKAIGVRVSNVQYVVIDCQSVLPST